MKRKISEKRKAYLKKNIDKAESLKLSKQEQQYVSRVKGGLIRSQQALRIDGKFISTDNPAFDMLKAIAKDKGVPLKEFYEQNEREFRSYIETQEITNEKTLEDTSRIVNELNRKYVSVNGEKVTTSEAMERIELLKNTVHSYLNSPVSFGEIAITGTGEVKLNLPTLEELEQFIQSIADEDDDLTEDIMKDWQERYKIRIIKS